MQKITPFLWFHADAEQAAAYYVSVFKDSRIDRIQRYDASGPGPKGSVMLVAFHIAGQPFVALNGGPTHTITPAISFVVTCKTQKELDGYWRKLAKGGKPGRCGWIQDRFGVSWQIIPVELPTLIRVPAAMQAMMSMGKIDIARVKRAAKRARATG